MTDTATVSEQSPFTGKRQGAVPRALGVVLGFGTLLVAGVAAFILTRDVPGDATSTAHAHTTPGAAPNAGPVTLDPEGARRIGVTFAPVVLEPLVAEVASVGQVTYDETRTMAISPKVDGWVEKLHVNFTGQEVREGDPLFEVYSPMLVTAQEELLLAARLARDVANGTEEARRAAGDMLVSARRRLLYWDVPASEVERIERTGQASRTVTLRSPSRGVVVEKVVLQGQRIMAGETVYRLADLREVWVEGEIFEHDLAAIRVGQQAAVDVQAYPGQQWHGTVSYVYPTVDASTRTARVRIALANTGQRLKPGMYATVHIAVATNSRVLSVPRSAVLTTGERTIVFVRSPNGELTPRDVVTGVVAGERIAITRGLREGDTVVSSATFLIDAESNVQSALSGMSGMPGMRPATPTPARPEEPDSMTDMSGTKTPPPAADHSNHVMPAPNAARPARGGGQ